MTAPSTPCDRNLLGPDQREFYMQPKRKKAAEIAAAFLKMIMVLFKIRLHHLSQPQQHISAPLNF